LTNPNGTNDFPNIPNAEADYDDVITSPVLPLHSLVVYPGVMSPVNIRSQQALAAVQAGLLKNRTVIGLMQRDTADSDATPDDLYMTGTEIALGRMLRLPDDSRTVLAQGRRRVEILEFVQTQPYLLARARIIQEVAPKRKDSAALTDTALNLFRQVAELNPAIPEEVMEYAQSLKDPGALADMIASTLSLPVEEHQRLLETRQIDQRLQQVAVLLGQELNMLELKDEINNQVQQEMDRGQREQYLREQMRIIQTELGETDIFQQEITDVRDQILDASLPPEIHERAMKELSRLMMMPPMAPEVGIIRTYIDWMTSIPWVKESDDNLDLRHAQRVLDSEHYGLPKIKERILEYIAVRKLTTSQMASPILCFVGPPGVGKTSLSKSIANALGRSFIRVSLGGVRDEAEIRGHRRTYIGAMPGRIIQTMRRAGTINPVFVLDEIDKLGQDFRGDPASALLEVLDPEQNNAYSDHYLEVPYDLSKVLFITTANELDPLPPALLDRLEIIEFPGYIEEEKVAIARRFLIPKQLKAHGLDGAKMSFDVRSLKEMIHDYTYEAGVRNLDREIANVCRKIARRVAEGGAAPGRILASKLPEYLGPPPYSLRLMQEEDAVGLATGLVWSFDGGDICIIEVSVLPGKGTLMMTGQLGEVMQESAQTAMSYMRSRAADFDVPSDDFENYDVHIHLPEGAVPKDGPSAGITLAAAIISAFTERKVRSDFAMTGEITLRGRVLPVGAVKEKVLAARRARIRNVILPAQNKKDLVDIPEEAKRDLKFHFVNDMDEVIRLVLLEPPPEGRRRDAERPEEEEKSAEAANES
jgi:ATP-dependent Lon protease